MAALIFRAVGDFKGFLAEPRYYEPAFESGDESVLGLAGSK
jgi:hypothetical protein